MAGARCIAGGSLELNDRAPLPADPLLAAALPEDALAALDAGLIALGLSDSLLPPARSALVGHLRLLLAWTVAINLTAVRDPVAAVRAHLLDSLSAVPLLRARGIDAFVDLGSGGGYPGLALAIGLPAQRALLVDSVRKKVRFLETALAAPGIAGHAGATQATAMRAEELAALRAHRGRWPCVTARAVAALPDLVELAFPILARGGVLVAWKRGELADEKRRALPAIEALGGGTMTIHPVDAGDGLPARAGHVLVVIEKSGSSGAAWPRSPAERRRRPW